MQKNPRKKRKHRDSDEEVIEQLQKEIRELKSINRSLLKRLKKVDREYHKALEEEEEESPRPKVKKEEFSCTNCGKGHLVDNKSIPGRVFKSCTSCDYRGKIEKLK